MRKYSVLILFAIMFFCAIYVQAGDENPVFDSLRCGICQKADSGKAYPSLNEITKAYNDDQWKIIRYLKGESDPIVNQEKSKTMENYREKTKSLSDDEVKSLADFILSHKE